MKDKKNLIDFEYDSNDILYNDNNLIILKGDTKEKCIKYGKEYSWEVCVDSVFNKFNYHRYGRMEKMFYFVFDKDKKNENRALLIIVDKNNKYYLANILNEYDYKGNSMYTWKHIIYYQPKLDKLKHLLKKQPLSQIEIDTYNKI